MLTHFALVILLLDIFIAAAPELRDWERFNKMISQSVSHVPLSPFFLRLKLTTLADS